MIRRENIRVFTLVCDSCKARQAFRCGTSWEALQLAGSRGWKGGKQDTCPRCPAPAAPKPRTRRR